MEGRGWGHVLCLTDLEYFKMDILVTGSIKKWEIDKKLIIYSLHVLSLQRAPIITLEAYKGWYMLKS